MSGYLLDTSVLSLAGPGKPPLPDEVTGWLRAHADDLFVPVIAVAEIEAGIAKLRRAGSTARMDRLSAWLDALVANYGTRVLPLDPVVARMAGRLSDAAVAKGRNPGFADVAIAAIAAAHNLTVLTRNVRHFEPLGVAHADPLANLPG
ncbi:MAG: PIN domain-containing protein [Litorimonas sp.]